MNRSVVIVAGGSGARMQSEVPKQFLIIGDKPVLMLTIELFHRFDNDISIIVVLPANQITEWERLCNEYDFDVPHMVTAGGSARYHSVKNGLMMVDNHDGLVAIHDGVRPFASLATLEACFNQAAKQGNSVPVIDAFESVRIISEDGSKAIDRSTVKLVQTPQVFSVKLIKECYSQPFQQFFTDDASVVEAAGHKIFITEGNRENIKITTPFDLKLAEVMLKQ